MDTEGDIYGPCPGSVLKFAQTCREELKKKTSVRVAGNLIKRLTERLLAYMNRSNWCVSLKSRSPSTATIVQQVLTHAKNCVT